MQAEKHARAQPSRREMQSIGPGQDLSNCRMNPLRVE